MRFSRRVHLYFDESGDYGFPADRFDCYVQAALVCPDELVAEIDGFVAARRTALAINELHATDLDEREIVGIAEFIAGSRLSLLASVTDTELVTVADIERHRLDQAAAAERNLKWYVQESTRVRGGPVPEIEQWMDRMIKRAGLASQISHGEFVQAQFLVLLIRSALQKALLVYSMAEWRDDSWVFDFVIDGKLPFKKGAGEKYLDDMLVPALGSQQGATLGLLDAWKDEPPHPFIKKYSQDRGRVRRIEVGGVTDLKAIFAKGLRFEASHEHAGLQLADAVAYIVRRAVLSPDNAHIQHAYDLLRPKLLNEDRHAITIHRLRGSEPADEAKERYRPLYGESR